MITKKKNGKEVEVQQGYKGKIIPFELVQDTLLQEQTAELTHQQDRLAQIAAELQESLDALTEEEKEDLSAVLNEDNTAYALAPLAKAAEELQKARPVAGYAADSLEAKQLDAHALAEEEKELKKTIKASEAKLHLLTKETIEHLTDEQAYKLLQQKWIEPLLNGLRQMPNDILNDLAAKVQTLASKYDTTLTHVEDEISKTEQELATMLGELTGNDADMQGLDKLKAMLGGK